VRKTKTRLTFRNTSALQNTGAPFCDNDLQFVGRTKRSAVPAIDRHLPERRSAWSGLLQKQQFLLIQQHMAQAGEDGFILQCV